MRVEALLPGRADPVPVSHEKGAAEQVGSDLGAGVSMLVLLRSHAHEGGREREERQLLGGGGSRTWQVQVSGIWA